MRLIRRNCQTSLTVVVTFACTQDSLVMMSEADKIHAITLRIVGVHLPNIGISSYNLTLLFPGHIMQHYYPRSLRQGTCHHVICQWSSLLFTVYVIYYTKFLRNS